MLMSQYDYFKFGNTIKSIRTKQDLSLKKLSIKSGLSVNTIRNVENGTFTYTMETISTLSFYLKTDLFEILSKQKNPLLDELFQIKSNLDIDLSNRDYSNLTLYIESLHSLWEEVKYNPNDDKHIEFFNYVDQMILWIKGIIKFNSKKFTEAEDLITKALNVTHPSFSLETIDKYHFSDLDLNLINSIISTRLESENFDNIDFYISFLKKELLGAQHHLHNIYIPLCFNTSVLYFHRMQYKESIDLVDETIEYMKKNNIQTDLSTLLITKAMARYKLELTDSTDEIKAALDSFIYEGKQDLIPTVIKNLKANYGVEVDYSISSSINNLLS